MKIFLDTANIEEIREANSWGVIDGVTTNPSLIAREGRDFKKTVMEICSIVDGPVSAEVVSTDAKGMVKEAMPLAKLHSNVVIKIPMGTEGLKAVKELSEKGIKTNMTLIFSANQALLAAKAGATYVSPFVGRLDDLTQPGMDMVASIVTVLGNYDFPTDVIVASVRHPMHVIEAAEMGADIATIPFKVLKQMVKHPLTDSGLKAFLSDWESANKKKGRWG